MAYFAQVKNNIVRRVIVADQEFIDKGSVGDPVHWVETFLNEPPHIYAGINYTYNPDENTFSPPPEDT